MEAAENWGGIKLSRRYFALRGNGGGDLLLCSIPPGLVGAHMIFFLLIRADATRIENRSSSWGKGWCVRVCSGERMEGYIGIGFQDPPPPPARPTDRVWRNGDFDLLRERKEGKRCVCCS